MVEKRRTKIGVSWDVSPGAGGSKVYTLFLRFKKKDKHIWVSARLLSLT